MASKPISKPLNRLDRYWHLRDDFRPVRGYLESELNRLGRTVKRSTSKQLLLAQADGAQRGRPDYQQIALAELQEFLRQRGLRHRDDHNSAVIALWRADNRLRFTRFLSLPPELRLRIYKYHFKPMPAMLRPCTQPPITKTSRLVRYETLPLFYSTFTFEILISHLKSGKRSYLRPETEVELFLAKTPDQHFCHLRKVHVRVETPRWRADGNKGVSMTSCDLLINPVAQTFRVKVKPSATKRDIVPWRNAGKVAEQRVRDVLEVACKREGAWGLRRDDVYEIRVVLEALFC